MQQQQTAAQVDTLNRDGEDSDNCYRPSNAFILNAQEIHSSVRQDNPTLSNNEFSLLIAKMLKELPTDTKPQYKRQAATMQEEFKRQHPDYTYMKARKKRAFNELLKKGIQGANSMMFPGADSMSAAIYQASMHPGMTPFQGQNPIGMYSRILQMAMQPGMSHGRQRGVGQMQRSTQLQGFQNPQGLMYIQQPYARQE
jgi:transcription factor SOX7/8/10/18 (SOX group E/F)